MDEAVTLDNPATAVREARQVTAEVLHRWRCQRERIEDAVLVVSEVVTNAVQHGGGTIGLRLCRHRTQIRVEVRDGSQVRPEPLNTSPTAERGRGLQIVSRLALGWGSQVSGAGKVVWVDLAC